MEHQDKDWTKEETDYLFRVVQEYDSRWYIVHDRYDFPGGVPRLLDVRSSLSFRIFLFAYFLDDRI
jgi:hypothetical protein